jgi:hypothetical protein
MGGVAGHLAHLYDNRDLTYNKMADILQKAASGELEGTEKTDGYNIYLGYIDGKPRAARNKGDMSRGGMDMQDLLNRKFKGGDKARNAYVKAFQAYESAINSLTEAERVNIFGPSGDIFYNTEIQGPMASNVVNYDENIINIHHMGHKRYNKDTNDVELVDAKQQSAFLDSLIDKFESAYAEHPFSIKRTAFLTLNQITDDKIVDETLEQIQKTGWSGDMTINDYLENRLWPEVDSQLPELEASLKQKLIDRILEKEGHLSLTQVKKGLGKDIGDKMTQFAAHSKKLIGELIWPIELVIHDFSVALLRGLKSAYILDNHKEVQRLKNETDAAIKAIYSYKGPEREEAHAVLARQLAKLKKHQNVDTAVEGFAFEHDGQMYKFTGNFAPMNQLLGLFKYGRGNIPRMVKESILEQNEGHNRKRIIAIYPGRFQPMGEHHVNVFNRLREEFGHGNTFISTSNTTDIELKDGVPRSPFDFHEKQMIASAHGIPAESFVMTNSPYNAKEILDNFDPEDTSVIYFVGDKDMSDNPRFGNLDGFTESGKPTYFKEYYEDQTLENYDEHGYVGIAPHQEIDLAGEDMSGTSLRIALKDADEVEFEDIMGFYDPEIYEFVKNKLSPSEDYEEVEEEELMEDTQQFLGIFRGLVDEILEEKKKKPNKASKKQISKKIPILKDEGYPHKQAIAIAHSMAEKDQLEEEELEEIAAMSGAAASFGAGPNIKTKRKERKLKEEEVNEAINYLLQKLGV